MISPISRDLLQAVARQALPRTLAEGHGALLRDYPNTMGVHHGKGSCDLRWGFVTYLWVNHLNLGKPMVQPC